jgi:hypothetical protein
VSCRFNRGIQATCAMIEGFVRYLIFGSRHSNQEHGAESNDDRLRAEDGSV